MQLVRSTDKPLDADFRRESSVAIHVRILVTTVYFMVIIMLCARVLALIYWLCCYSYY